MIIYLCTYLKLILSFVLFVYVKRYDAKDGGDASPQCLVIDCNDNNHDNSGNVNQSREAQADQNPNPHGHETIDLQIMEKRNSTVRFNVDDPNGERGQINRNP